MTPYQTTDIGRLIYEICKDNPEILWEMDKNALVRAIWAQRNNEEVESILRTLREDKLNLETWIPKPELALWENAQIK